MPLAVFFGIDSSCSNASTDAALADGDTARAMSAMTQSCGAPNRARIILFAVVFIACFSLIDLEQGSWVNRSCAPWLHAFGNESLCLGEDC